MSNSASCRPAPQRAGARLAFSAALAILAIGWTAHAHAAKNRAERREAARWLVEKALEQEVHGSPSGRGRLLEVAREYVPGYEPAMWHAGYVRQRNDWLRFDEVPEAAAENRLLRVYRSRRDRAPETVAGQLDLARWCLRHHLHDRARAHFSKVIELEPDHPEARARLGFRRVDGAWLSAEEIVRAGRRAEAALQALREWRPRLEKIRENLFTGAPKVREVAAERLRAVDDPAAIPVLELVISNASSEAGLMVVDVLSDMSEHEAAVSLARHAVFSPFEEVRKAALTDLQSRPYEDFVPVLLASMNTPVLSRFAIYEGPRGRLMYRHAFYREGQGAREVSVFDMAFRRRARPGGNGEETLARALDAAVDTAEAREVARERQNLVARVVNERICSVLSDATGAEVLPVPQEWWKWWNNYNEVFVVDRPIRQRYRAVEIEVADRGSSSGSGGGGSTGGFSMPSDCLAAGTPVWTELGPVPIEKVEVGDRVLSQDVRSGELAYKPVLRTTVRPVGPLVKVNLGDEAVECSGGHPFWVSGDGWTKARRLEASHPVHAVEGFSPVRAVEPGGRDRTYNLVVGDFHNYFVGKSKILCHDNTIPGPTDAVVPGLLED